MKIEIFQTTAIHLVKSIFSSEQRWDYITFSGNHYTHLLFHGVHSDRESRVVPFHFWFLIHGNDLCAVMCGADTDDAQDDHEHQETDTDDNNDCHTNAWERSDNIWIKIHVPKSIKSMAQRKNAIFSVGLTMEKKQSWTKPSILNLSISEGITVVSPVCSQLC